MGPLAAEINASARTCTMAGEVAQYGQWPFSSAMAQKVRLGVGLRRSFRLDRLVEGFMSGGATSIQQPGAHDVDVYPQVSYVRPAAQGQL